MSRNQTNYYCFATGREKQKNLQNGHCVICQKGNCRISIWMLQHNEDNGWWSRSNMKNRWEFYNYCDKECFLKDPSIYLDRLRHLREYPEEGFETYVTPTGVSILF